MAPAGKVPKKPGNIPPFALFVQDHRPGILEENRDIRFVSISNLSPIYRFEAKTLDQPQYQVGVTNF